MVNHYLNIAYSILYCFEPFCCCTVLSSTSHASGLSSLMQDHCRPQVDRPSSCTPKLQKIFIYTIQLKGGFF